MSNTIEPPQQQNQSYESSPQQFPPHPQQFPPQFQPMMYQGYPPPPIYPPPQMFYYNPYPQFPYDNNNNLNENKVKPKTKFNVNKSFTPSRAHEDFVKEVNLRKNIENNNNNNIIQKDVPEVQDNENSLKFITTTNDVFKNDLKIPLIIDSNTTTNSNKNDEDLIKNDSFDLIFKYSHEDKIDLDSLIFGATLNEFISQKQKFVKKDDIKPTETIQWATIAQKAVDKQPVKSVPTKSIIHVIQTVKKDDVKLIPTISNVLEPLGSVVLKLMFDQSFQNHFIKFKYPKIIPRGLVNTGNICFMSSILQLLLYCKPFYQTLNIISNKTVQSLDDSKFPLFESIISLYKYFNIDNKKKFGDSITPTEFYKSISSNERFQHLKWGQQEDAEEFFGYLMDGLHEEFILSISNLNQLEIKNLLDSIIDDDYRLIIKNELKKYNDNENNENNDSNKDNEGWKEVGSNSKTSDKRSIEIKSSPITQLFGGSFRSILNIPKQKENQSITLDPFQQIQLDISSNDVETLEDAFKKISEIEEIPHYKLNNGNEVIAKKQTFIDKLPQVLVIHLKRFSFDSSKIEKICKKIKFNHNLKIPDEIISSTTKKFNSNYLNELNYKLIGVVYHIGKNSDGGHYTVDVLQENNEWLSIDDTLITELKPENVLDGNGQDEGVKTAYILMYQRI